MNGNGSGSSETDDETPVPLLPISTTAARALSFTSAGATDNLEVGQSGMVPARAATVNCLPPTNQVKEIHTVIRDAASSRTDFVFYADRLIRLIVEEGLNLLPYTNKTVHTPSGSEYQGLAYVKGTCGVSVVRSGEAMEKGLRDCCRSIRIGKILVDHDGTVIYVKLPPGISEKRVLLMYPIVTTGRILSKAIDVLLKNKVAEERILLLSLFSTPASLEKLSHKFPKLKILTSEIDEAIPKNFGSKYFGTD